VSISFLKSSGSALSSSQRRPGVEMHTSEVHVSRSLLWSRVGVRRRPFYS
jgi:hypothetical protein